LSFCGSDALEPAWFVTNICHAKIKACQKDLAIICFMLEIGHCDQNFGKLLEISETLQEKRLLVGTKPNEYLNFLPTLWHALILISQYIGLP